MWMHHLQQSPYCHTHYAVLCNTKGQDVCQCGWVGPKAPTIAPGVSFGALMRQREEESDGWDAYEPNTYSGD